MYDTYDTYKNLIERFPTTEALFSYLRSQEGGRLIIRQSNDVPLSVIYYDKTVTNMELPHVRAFRSVVWDDKKNRPVCVSPHKGFDLATSSAAVAAHKRLRVEDFVDGVMINQFWDGTQWRLSTRTTLDAKSSFYGTYRQGPSFAELFDNTLKEQTGMTRSQFPTIYCYSWVLQHPAERIVVGCKYGIPTITLVGCYLINPVTADVTLVEPDNLNNIPRPTLHTDLCSVEDCIARAEAWGRRFKHEFQGLVAYHPETGIRYRIRTAEYTAARELRGNQSNLRYLWLERWSQGRLAAYLSIYPEETAEAENTIAEFKRATEELYHWYQRVYKHRELPLGQVPHKFRKFLWDIHRSNAGAYFPALRAYVNGQDTARKLWLVNYDKRYGSAVSNTTDNQ